MKTGRREFLRAALAGAAGIALSAPRYSSGSVNASDARIEVLLSESLGTISPNIYGHFIEHLGGVVYDGVWVGESSRIANINGIRKELVDQLRRIKAPMVRYPGGCFADSYDWRDGIGPKDKRPKRTNFWAGDSATPAIRKYETNQFGTDEFMRLCRLVGCQPYLAANVRSLTAQDFYRWVEYCNSPQGTTSLAEARALNGSAEPYHVRYWGVGNEAWGCGGNFTAQEYAVEFRRFTSWVPGFGEQLSFVASGADSDKVEWTRGFFDELVKKGKEQLKSVYGIALHHYAWNLSRGRTADWDLGKGDALNFDIADWYEILREGDRMESLIKAHWDAMGEFDSEHRVKLVVDEWGPWYKPGSAQAPGYLLEQTPTMRDAVFSGMTLDIFNRNPDKVAMAATAQLVNCLNSPFLASEDNFIVTPVGHVFAMYAPHQGGQSVRTVFSTPEIHYQRDDKPASFWGLRGSASLHEKQLTLTVVNPSTADLRETEVVVRGASVRSGTATTLSALDIHAHNSFAQPNAVVPRTAPLRASGSSVRLTLPPASVVSVQLVLE